eukprot:s1010_g26.t1
MVSHFLTLRKEAEAGKGYENGYALLNKLFEALGQWYFTVLKPQDPTELPPQPGQNLQRNQAARDSETSAPEQAVGSPAMTLPTTPLRRQEVADASDAATDAKADMVAEEPQPSTAAFRFVVDRDLNPSFLSEVSLDSLDQVPDEPPARRPDSQVGFGVPVVNIALTRAH